MSYTNFGTQINTVNHRVWKSVTYCKSYDIPIVLSANVRGITKKVDEIQQIAELNNVSVICATETWLSSNVRFYFCYSRLQHILERSSYYYNTLSNDASPDNYKSWFPRGASIKKYKNIKGRKQDYYYMYNIKSYWCLQWCDPDKNI